MLEVWVNVRCLCVENEVSGGSLYCKVLVSVFGILEGYEKNLSYGLWEGSYV